MQKVLMITAIMLISACSMFVADRLSEEKKSAGDYAANHTYCQENPAKCGNSIL